MRRRKKPRVAWLPLTNAHSIGADAELSSTVYNLFSFGVTGTTGTTFTEEIPLVLDAQVSWADAGASLADIESSGYRLRRVVGKIWVQAGQTTPDPDTLQITPISAIVTAALMVRNADTATGASNAILTAGSTAASPALIENTGDPWIWRRSWIVGNNWSDANVVQFAGTKSDFIWALDPVPCNNWDNKSALDGPHVDQKTGRIVGPEHRLFLDVGATVLSQSSNPGEESPLDIAIITDLRILGSLRQTQGNRRNSTR